VVVRARDGCLAMAARASKAQFWAQSRLIAGGGGAGVLEDAGAVVQLAAGVGSSPTTVGLDLDAWLLSYPLQASPALGPVLLPTGAGSWRKCRQRSGAGRGEARAARRPPCRYVSTCLSLVACLMVPRCLW
jgi:hypothetical protein